MKARSQRFADCIRYASILGFAAIIANTAIDTTQGAEGVTRAKNIILMISDGTGTNTIAATGMYTGKLGKQIYDGPNWTKAYVSTYPLRTGETPLEGPAG